MTDDNIHLSRRKILAGLGAVGAAGAGTGLGTSALFSDEESFEGNTITAGTLDLQIDWAERYFNGIRNLGEDCEAAVRYLGEGESPNADEVGFPVVGDPLVAVAETDVPAFLECTTSSTYDGQEERPDGIVSMADVKPGDFGTVTVGYGIDDNPGFVQLEAEFLADDEVSVTGPEATADGEDQTSDDPDDEMDGELGETIQAALWHDPNGAAQLGNGQQDPTVLAEGTLAEVLETGTLLDPEGAGGSPGWDTGDGCHVPGVDCVETLYVSDSGGSGNFDDETRLYEVELDDDENTAVLSELVQLPDDNFTQTDAVAATPYVPGYQNSPIGPASSNALFVFDKLSTHLGRYDLESESFEDLGPVDGLVTEDEVVLLSFDPQGQLWAVGEANGEHVYQIEDFESDPSATQAASVSDVEVRGADIAYDSTGTLYLYSNADDTLYTVDRETGDTTAVGSSNDENGYITGLAIQSAGTGNIVTSSEDASALVVLDKQDGSEVSEYEMIRGGDDYEYGYGDLAFNQLCPEYAVTLEWWLPVETGNEIQSDSVEFDLTLRTEQCRNNASPFDQ